MASSASERTNGLFLPLQGYELVLLTIFYLAGMDSWCLCWALNQAHSFAVQTPFLSCSVLRAQCYHAPYRWYFFPFFAHPHRPPLTARSVIAQAEPLCSVLALSATFTGSKSCHVCASLLLLQNKIALGGNDPCCLLFSIQD